MELEWGEWRDGAIERWDRHGHSQWVLGEDQNGDLWVPSLRRKQYWNKRFNPLNPLHFLFWLYSKKKRQMAMIEVYP